MKHLPFDVVKIDGDFIKDLPTQHDRPADRAGDRADRARDGQGTIAEFVQDEETVEMLREMGVDFAQGYWLGRPVPAEVVPAWAGPWM